MDIGDPFPLSPGVSPAPTRSPATTNNAMNVNTASAAINDMHVSMRGNNNTNSDGNGSAHYIEGLRGQVADLLQQKLYISAEALV